MEPDWKSGEMIKNIHIFAPGVSLLADLAGGCSDSWRPAV